MPEVGAVTHQADTHCQPAAKYSAHPGQRCGEQDDQRGAGGGGQRIHARKGCVLLVEEYRASDQQQPQCAAQFTGQLANLRHGAPGQQQRRAGTK